MSRKKEFDIESIIGKRSVSRPLCFVEGGREIKADYNLDVYCDLLKEVYDDLKFAPDSLKDQKEFECSFGEIIFELSDDENDEDIVKNEDEDAEKKKENYHKRIYRIHNRILNGREGESNTVASDKKCYHFLKKVEECCKKQILIPLRDDIPYYHENMYIFSLISQLIGIMNTSEVYNYVPNSSNYQRDCFCNHLKLIEGNIDLVFSENKEYHEKWFEILRPFQQMIYECSYPGLHENDIWVQYCRELRFFDCAYEIAKNYKMYSRMSNRLVFNLGSNINEVMKEVDLCKEFFDKKQKSEKELFCEMMLNTLTAIAKKEFSLEV